jgi:hypothetical protein
MSWRVASASAVEQLVDLGVGERIHNHQVVNPQPQGRCTSPGAGNRCTGDSAVLDSTGAAVKGRPVRRSGAGAATSRPPVTPIDVQGGVVTSSI